MKTLLPPTAQHTVAHITASASEYVLVVSGHGTSEGAFLVTGQCDGGALSIVPETDEGAGGQQDKGLSCWGSLPALVPSAHAISELDTDRSSQGEAYLAERFCPGWSSFIFASCDPEQQSCDSRHEGGARGALRQEGGL